MGQGRRPGRHAKICGHSEIIHNSKNELVGPVNDPFCPLFIVLLCKSPSETWCRWIKVPFNMVIQPCSLAEKIQVPSDQPFSLQSPIKTPVPLQMNWREQEHCTENGKELKSQAKKKWRKLMHSCKKEKL